MENFNITSTPTSERGTLAVNSPSGLVTADDPEPNGSPKFLLSQKRNRRVDYILVETSEGAELGKDLYIKDKDDVEGVSAEPKLSGMDMAGTPDVSAS
eukprot:725361-Pleurochrysis_carterae.AAC.1